MREDPLEMIEAWEDGGVESRSGRGRPRGARSTHVFSLFEKQSFNFTFLGINESKFVVIERALHVVPFFFYWMLVRVHNIDIQHVAGNFSLRAWNTLPSRQDPREFTATVAPLTVLIPQTAVAPSLLSTNVSSPGPIFKIELEARQGATANQRLYVEISAVLYGRAT